MRIISAVLELARGCGALAGILRSWRVQRAFLVMAGGISAAAQAHLVSPLELEIYVGDRKTFTVADAATCSATIGAVSGDENIVTVEPSSSAGISVEFTAQASTTNPGETSIAVTWVGEDFGGDGPCQENNSDNPVHIAVKVIDPADTSSANNDNSGSSGDPVNTFNGELYMSAEPDLDLGGPMPLVFKRYYASYLRRSFIEGGLGDNWLHNFDWRIHWVGNLITLVTDRGRVLKYTSDGAGDWTRQTATAEPIDLVQDNQEIVILNPRDNRIYRFNASGRLSEISDGKGNVHTLTYYDTVSDWGRLKEVSDGLGRALRFSYVTTGNLRKLGLVQAFQDGVAGRAVQFDYDDSAFPFNLTRIQDARGKYTAFAYADTSGTADRALLLSKTRPRLNVPYSQTYYDTSSQFDSGKVKTQTDAFGNTSSFSYSDSSTTLTDALGDTQTHSHDDQGSLTSRVDQTGNTQNFGADDSKRRTSVSDRQGETRSYGFHDPTGRIVSRTDKLGGTTHYSYTQRNDSTGLDFYDLTGITYADGSSESFSYDSSGNRTAHSDQLGHGWSYTYNDRGQTLTETTPLGGVTTYTYNSDGTRSTKTDHAGNITGFDYDAQRRLADITYQDGNSRGFTYNQDNQRLSFTDERNNTWTRTYDDNGNLSSITGPLSNTVTYDYDDMDRLSSVTDALGHTSTVTYDELGRFETRTDRAGATTSNEYDERNNLTKVTDQGGFAWRVAYDADNQVVSTTNPLDETIGYTRDAEGRLTLRTWPSGAQDGYRYDVMGRLVEAEDPQGDITRFDYDARSRLSSVSLDDGSISVAYERNALGQITTLTDPLGQPWQFGFDAQGRITSRSDPLFNTTSFTYDTRNRMSTVTFPGSLGSVSLTYDATGNVTRRAYSDGTTFDYTYNANNLRTTATGASLSYDGRQDMISSNGLTNTRDEVARIETVTLAPGKTVTYSYNPRGLVVGVNDWAGGSVTMEYDDAGRVSTVTRSNGMTTSYQYDSDGRISAIDEQAATSTVSNIDLTRNARGQVIAATRNTPSTASVSDSTASYSYDEASQREGASYDALGRMTSDGERTYTWNLASQLTRFSDGTETVDYEYDAFGLMIGRNSRSYVWNYAFELPSISVVRASGGADERYYIHTPDGRLLYSVEASDNGRHFYHFDERGNTIFLTDDAGDVTDSYAYTPYGSLVATSGSFDQPFTYLGQVGVMREGESGLYRMRRRVYDSHTQRFLSREPVAGQMHPLTVNPYQYAAADPMRYMDPLGENTEQMSGAEAVGFANTQTSAFEKGLGFNAPKGSRAANVSKGLGTATTVVSGGLVVYNTNERMDRVSNRFMDEVKQAWADYKHLLAEANRAYRNKENFTLEDLRELRRELKKRLEERLERAEDRHLVDSVAVGAIATLNTLTNLIPFGGVVVDWSDHIEY